MLDVRSSEEKKVKKMCVRTDHKARLTCLAVLVLGFATTQAAELVSIESLLHEMTDRDSVARFPETDFRLKQHGSAHYTVESCGHMMVATLEAGKNLHISVIVVNIGQEATAGSTFIRLSSSGTTPPTDTATRVLASTGTVKLASLRSDLAHDH